MRPFLFDHEAETDLWATAPGIYNANGRGWRSPSRVGEIFCNVRNRALVS